MGRFEFALRPKGVEDVAQNVVGNSAAEKITVPSEKKSYNIMFRWRELECGAVVSSIFGWPCTRCHTVLSNIWVYPQTQRRLSSACVRACARVDGCSRNKKAAAGVSRCAKNSSLVLFARPHEYLPTLETERAVSKEGIALTSPPDFLTDCSRALRVRHTFNVGGMEDKVIFETMGRVKI